MYTYTVGISGNGRQVYADIVNSPAARSLGRYPYLANLIKGVIATRDLTGKRISITQEMGRNIGNTNIVTTVVGDTIFYAQQIKQGYASRFVKNRSMEPSSQLSLILGEDNEGNYELKSVWIGPACPPFPGSPDADKDSKPYWQSHALTAGSEPITLQSKTSVCPY